MKKSLIVLLMVAIVGTGVFLVFNRQTTTEGDALTFIKQQGVTVLEQFDTPAGVTGYVGTFKDEPMSIYILPDQRYAIVGDLINAEGKNLGAEAIYQLVTKPNNEKVWQRVESASWVQDGDKNAPQVIYTFSDPFCPYCHKFRELAEPYIKSGKVQFRHVMVGILRDDSLAKAATILGSDSPEQALATHITRYKSGGIETDNNAASKGSERVLENNHLMEDLHFHATPTSLYKDEKGDVQIIEGLPMKHDMDSMFGPGE